MPHCISTLCDAKLSVSCTTRARDSVDQVIYSFRGITASTVHCVALCRPSLTSSDWLPNNDICKIPRRRLNSSPIDRFCAGLPLSPILRKISARALYRRIYRRVDPDIAVSQGCSIEVAFAAKRELATVVLILKTYSPLSGMTFTVTLNDLARWPLFCVISPNSVALGPIMSQRLKLDPYCLLHKCRPENLVLGNIWFVVTFSEITAKRVRWGQVATLESVNSNCATLRNHLNNSWAPGTAEKCWAVMELFVNIYLYEFVLSLVCVRVRFFGLYWLSYGIEVNPSAVLWVPV